MTSPDKAIPVMVITGPVGAGKSTVADALSNLLAEHAVHTALVDMDYLRRLYPARSCDPHRVSLGLRNLAAIWPNLLAEGATCVVLADVVEDMNQLDTYQSAMPGSTVTVVRLDVPLDLVYSRLALRESAESLAWHMHRAPELQTIMVRVGIGDLVISVGERSPEAVADEIATRLHLIG